MNDFERVRYALETVGHPVRLIILDAARRGEITANDVSVVNKLPLGTVAYHVRALHQQGVLRTTKTRRVRGAVQSYYRITARGNKIWNKIFPDD